MGSENQEGSGRGTRYAWLVVLALLATLVLTACASGAADTMRGEQVTALSCNAQGLQGRTFQAAEVRVLMVCPMSGQSPGNRIEVLSRTSAFTHLINALSRPSAPRSHQACPALRIVINRILANTTKGDFIVLPPVDSCGIVQQGVVTAVRQLAG